MDRFPKLFGGRVLCLPHDGRGFEVEIASLQIEHFVLELQGLILGVISIDQADNDLCQHAPYAKVRREDKKSRPSDGIIYNII